jgi:hypothetical protein
LYRLYRGVEPARDGTRLTVSKGELTMFRTVIAAAVIVTIALTAETAAQSAAPIRKLSVPAASQWTVIRAGQRTVSHCVLGLRSDAAAPSPGRPQFMFTADGEFAILRVRAAEWSFSGGREITVSLATTSGNERQPAAAVRGADLIDIAFGTEPERLKELAAASHLDIRTEGTSVRLPLGGLKEVLPAYRDCLASIGQPMAEQGMRTAAIGDAR